MSEDMKVTLVTWLFYGVEAFGVILIASFLYAAFLAAIGVLPPPQN